MFLDEHFHGRTPEFPEYVRGEKRPLIIQANWAQEEYNKPDYIRNKPNLVLTVNGAKPDANGDLDMKQVIGGISNEDIYAVCEDVFHDVL